MFIMGTSAELYHDDKRIYKDNMLLGTANDLAEAIMKLSMIVIKSEKELFNPLGYMQDFPSEYSDRYCLATYSLDKGAGTKIKQDFCIKKV